MEKKGGYPARSRSQAERYAANGCAMRSSDAFGFALIGDVDVDLRRSYVDVAGERPDDLQGGAALGEHRAAQGVRGAAVLANTGRRGVLGDDVADRSGRQRLGDRRPPASQADEQRLGAGRWSRGIPAPQRVVCLSVQRTVRVRPCFDPRTTTSSGLWSPRLGRSLGAGACRVGGRVPGRQRA